MVSGKLKRPATKRSTSKKAAPKTTSKRSDFGAPIDTFFEKQPPHLRAILEELRRILEQIAPDAEASLKWGMPWFTIAGNMMCSLSGHKAHVNLVLMGPATAFEDPEGLLAESSANGRHLKLISIDEIPRDAVRHWLRTAATLARKGV